MKIKSAGGQSGFGHDSIDSNAVISALSKEPAGDLEDSPVGLFFVRCLVPHRSIILR